MPPKYQSIFFDDDWVLQKYQGWLRRTGRQHIKVLEKSYGILKRVLVLCDRIDDHEITATLNEDCAFAPTSEIIVHDFSSAEATERSICGRVFVPALERERLINKSTFVLDLSKSQETLLSEMRQGFRQSIKKSIDCRTIVEVSESPAPHLMDNFLMSYNKMAQERGLSLAHRFDLERMFQGGNLVIGAASSGDATSSFALVYLTAQKAYYLKGVSVGNADDAGKYLHYELINYLKSRHIAWYDLGGVPAIDERNGIYLFKKGFGGELVRLGAEFVYRPMIVRGALAGVRALRTIRAAVGT